MTENRKFLVTLDDGLQVEAVWYGSGTLCLSSQAGCGMGCPFCASGRNGLQRNLRLEELHLQLDRCRQAGVEPRRLTLSGIGEPLQNLAAVSSFVADCRRRKLPVSVTTTGAPLASLKDLLKLPHNGLMLSLHAGTDRVYRRLVPSGPGLALLHRQLEEVWPELSRRQRRRLGANYLLLEGVNDHYEELSALVAWLRPFPEMTLHLLFCNPVAGSAYRSPERSEGDRVYRFLCQSGLHVRRANRWRQQLEGGCGTLVLGQAAPGGRQDRIIG